MVLQAELASVLMFGMIQLSAYSAQLVYKQLQAALEVSGDYSSAALVIPIVNSLQQSLTTMRNLLQMTMV